MSVQETLNNYRDQKFYQQAHYICKKANVLNEYISGQDGAKDIYDIASLTKVIVTGTMLFAALSEKKLKLEQKINEFKCIQKISNATNTQRISIGDLVSHTSGIIPWFPLYCLNKEDLPMFFDFILQTAVDDQKRRYSDLDFMLLRSILEEVMNEKIDVWFEKNVNNKLGLTKTGFKHQIQQLNAFVPTSQGNPFELYLANKTLNEQNEKLKKFGIITQQSNLNHLRKHRLVGECNDANTNFLGGVSSHAGLFSTPQELFKILDAWMQNEWQAVDWIKNFIQKKQTGKEYLFCFSKETLDWGPEGELFGHHGFTGCSIAINKEFKNIFIFCSNRQYFGLDENNNYPAWKRVLNSLYSA